jgi:hypothetical protein
MLMVLWLWIMKLETWVFCEVWGSHNNDYKIAGMWYSVLCTETTETVTIHDSSFL